MGEVWRAYDTLIERTVAIKTLLPHFAQDKTFEQRFRREARATARLDDPHVVPIYDFGEIDARLYVTMRLVNGRDLQSLLSKGPLNLGQAVAIVEQISAALQAAHNAGLVHRDVKPSNVLITPDGFAYLIDFGIARVAGETSVTTTGATIGTWAYMAPERFSSGEIEPSSDIYALACVLYQSMTGRLPFPGTTLEQVAMAHMVTPPPKPSAQRGGIAPAMDDVIAIGLAKKPDQRYKTATELAVAARTALSTKVRPTPSRVSSAATQPAPLANPAPPAKKVLAKPSTAYRQTFAPTVGAWVQVITAGDGHHHQVGKIIEICQEDDDDDDDLDIIVSFPGERHSYAFRREELVPAPQSAEDIPIPAAPADDEDFWLKVGIDPIRIITSAHDYLTLRCYLDGVPIFLGTSGMINVFPSARKLRRHLAGNPSNDMSSLVTYSDIMVAAIDGVLPLDDVTDENVYVIKGLADDIADGPAHVDRQQLELAVELLSDVGAYANNSIVTGCLREGMPLGDLVNRVLGIDRTSKRTREYAAWSQWRQLEDFLGSRLRTKGW